MLLAAQAIALSDRKNVIMISLILTIGRLVLDYKDIKKVQIKIKGEILFLIADAVIWLFRIIKWSIILIFAWSKR